tara:strand:- start:7159 stop:7578 length:420 start_codon:yes stop_codon:yes gene_type:complete
MKDKNYHSSRGAGDGDLTAGLLGMMKGGGAMEYPAIMKAQKGGDSSSLTRAQIKAYNESEGNAPGLTSQGLKDNIKNTMVQNRSENKATRQARRAARKSGDSTKASRVESRAATKANRNENAVLRKAKRVINSNQRRGY